MKRWLNKTVSCYFLLPLFVFSLNFLTVTRRAFLYHCKGRIFNGVHLVLVSCFSSSHPTLRIYKALIKTIGILTFFFFFFFFCHKTYIPAKLAQPLSANFLFLNG